MAGPEDPKRVHSGDPTQHPRLKQTVVGLREKHLSSGLAGSVFVGRKRELRLFQSFLKKADAGYGSVVLIEGEPGIGKTRLAEEVAKCAWADGMEVAWGRCCEGEGAPAFWPWIQLLRSLAARHHRPELELLGSLATGPAELVQILPQLREFGAELGEPAEPLNADHARFRVFDSVTLLLKKLAERRARVLILEDVHWADHLSLRLLEYLGSQVADARLVLVATYRDAEVPRQAVLRNTLAALARASYCERFVLEGFTPEDISELVARSAGGRPADSLVSALHAQTEGNPFFVGEVVRLLVASGEADAKLDALPHPLRIPDTVRDVIQRRLDLLSAECRSVLATAAVVGLEFGLQVLLRVNTDLTKPVLSLIDEAIEIRIVARVPYGVGRYRFVHVLIQQTIYESLTEQDRARLHSAVGDALELEGIRPQEPAAHSALMAHHYFRGLPYANAEKAFFWAITAAAHASHTSAHERAVEHYQKAVAALGFTDADGSRRCDLLLSLGEAQNRAGEISPARHTFRVAAQLARERGLTEQFSRAALGFGGVLPAAAADTELVGLLEEAISMCGERLSPSHAKARAALSIAIHFHGDYARRLRLAEQAVEMARTLNDSSAELLAFEALHYAFLKPSGLLRRIEIGRQMAFLAERVGDAEAAFRVRQRLGVDLLELGDTAGFNEAVNYLEYLAAKLRQPRYETHCLLYRAMRALIFGRFDEADKLALEALQLAERIGDERAKSSFWAQTVWSQRDRGGSHELDRILWQGCVKFPAETLWRTALVLVLSEANHIKEATDLLHAFVSRRQLKLPEDAFFLCSASLLAAAVGLLNDFDRSNTLYRALLPYRNRFVAVGLAGVWLGPVTHYLGILATSMRQWKVAMAHFNDALQKCEAIGAHPLAARTRYEVGKMWAVRGEKERAGEWLGRAAAGFERFGMTVCLERATSELAALGRTSSVGDPVAHSQAAEADTWMSKAVSSIGSPPTASCIFRREGDYWTVAYGGKISRLKHRRGFAIIAQLLGRPHGPVHSIDLSLLAVPDREENEAALVEAGLRVTHVTSGGVDEPLLDERARIEYRARFRELSLELEEAERSNDLCRAAGLRREFEFLRDHLSASLRRRRNGHGLSRVAERARIRVRNSVKNAIRAIGQQNESLERHLTNSVKTGAFCVYAPESLPSWQL